MIEYIERHQVKELMLMDYSWRVHDGILQMVRLQIHY